LRENALGKIIYCRLAYNGVVVLLYERRGVGDDHRVEPTGAPNDAGQ
jgi:hypothetical protein